MTAVAEELPFSRVIREATKDAHGTAQHSGFMADLFAGTLSLERYARYVAQTRFIYQAIEDAAVVLHDDPVVAPFLHPALTRVPAVDAELRFLLGDAWRESLVPTAATGRYVQAITRASNWSGGFVAHHYVRYLGDLSGGQHIAKTVARIYGFELGDVRSLVFDIDDPDAFKEAYRRHLDEAPWDRTERRAALDEIFRAYELATEMLHDL